MSLEQIIDAAIGSVPCDLVIKNAKIVNVFNGEIERNNIGIYQGIIVGIGDYESNDVIDIDGKYVCPGLFDAHVHIESSMVEVPEYAKAVVPTGTTSVIIDPHEIANVLGLDGIRYMLESSKYNPLNVFVMLPSCVPATRFETAGAYLRAFDLYPLMRDKWILGLGEVMNFPGVLNKEPEVLDKIKMARNNDKRIDGHAPGLSGKELNAYIAAGIYSDHECTKLAEAKEKLARGMFIMIREGTATKNLNDLIPLISEKNSRRILFATDDRHPNDLLNSGHIDYMLRQVIKKGVDPITAIRIATLNAAEYYKLSYLGAIAPGYIADFIILDDLQDFRAEDVYKRGQLVAHNGKLVVELNKPSKIYLRSSVNIKWVADEDFKIKVPPSAEGVRVIGLIKDQIITKNLIETPKITDGFAVSDTERDILKIAVVERHNAADKVSLGFVNGIGLKRGAVAQSIAHDSHNIVAVGVNDGDMLRAVVEVSKLKGGIAIIEDGKVIESLQLSVAGLMSDKSPAYVRDKLNAINRALNDMGSQLQDVVMTLSFLCLPVIPSLKITDNGIFDADKFEFVDLFIKKGGKI